MVKKIKMNKIFKILLLVVMAAFLATSCKYDWIIPEEVPVIDPDDPSQQISFSTQILPIFSGNNCTSCHNGSQIPDLRDDRAYAAINTTRYINKSEPQQSRIYTVAHPDLNNHYRKYTATQAAVILAWIQQGAKNN
jgi:hypothetical protein